MSESPLPEPAKKKRNFLKGILPLLVILLAIMAVGLMVALKPKPEKQEPEKVLPVVEALELQSNPVTLSVTTQGTVVPRTETVLTAEVSGKIEWVSPDFEDGGFFEEGEVLLRIDPVQYRAAVASAEAALAQAELALRREEALSEQARLDWEALGRGEASDLTLRKPQLRQARANVASAQAALALARQNLERTEVRAPYEGRVRRKQVDLGQRVNAGVTQLAQVYAVDIAEVRLPLAAEETGYLDLPDLYRGDKDPTQTPRVLLTATYGGRSHTWEGHLDRTEGAIDPRSRMTYVVVQVVDPYGRDPRHPDRPPLKVGMFVEAVIAGQRLPSAFEIPRGAVKTGDVVYLIDDSNRLRARPVDIAKMDADTAIVTGGLSDGDRICMTPLTFFVEGMAVLPVDENGEVEEGRAGGGTAAELAEAESAQGRKEAL